MTGDDDARARIGTTLDGRYRIVGVLGRGGMGVVYEAEHLALAKRVAIKTIGDTAGDARARFARAARAASRVSHPNVTGRAFQCRPR